jgi:hypothetical protein
MATATPTTYGYVLELDGRTSFHSAEGKVLYFGDEGFPVYSKELYGTYYLTPTGQTVYIDNNGQPFAVGSKCYQENMSVKRHGKRKRKYPKHLWGKVVEEDNNTQAYIDMQGIRRTQNIHEYIEQDRKDYGIHVLDDDDYEEDNDDDDDDDEEEYKDEDDDDDDEDEDKIEQAPKRRKVGRKCEDDLYVPSDAELKQQEEQDLQEESDHIKEVEENDLELETRQEEHELYLRSKRLDEHLAPIIEQEYKKLLREDALKKPESDEEEDEDEEDEQEIVLETKEDSEDEDYSVHHPCLPDYMKF